jgi:alkanesulfonate monooxygenase SsuD/methylene tetrahydromethanopterin reductase-like flavin-dependent oxidoreductase (luciferase family)
MTARRSPAQRLSCLTALMGLTVNTPALGLYAWSPRPTQKPAPPRWFFGGAGRTPQYLRHRNFDVVTRPWGHQLLHLGLQLLAVLKPH